MPATTRFRCLVFISIAALLMGTVGTASAADPKPRPKPPTNKPAKPAEPAKPPEPVKPPEPKLPSEKVENLFDLAGQAGLPKYLKCNQDTMADLKGLRGGQVRTVETDFFRRDFTLDVVFKFTADGDRRQGVVGIGQSGQDGGGVWVELGDPLQGGESTIHQSRRGEQKLGKYNDHLGPHLLRVQKKGPALTFALSAKFEGTFEPDFVKTVADLSAAAPNLNRLNSGLFFGGSATFTGVRLTVDDVLVDAGPRADANGSKVFDEGPDAGGGWMRLVPGQPMPPYWSPNAEATFDRDGLDLRRAIIKTSAGTYLTRDFTLDVVYRFKPQERDAFVLGVGENGRDSGNWVKNSYVTKVHAGGDATTTFHSFAFLRTYGRMGPEHLGPNLLRMQKRGDTLMFAVCVGYKGGRFEPDFVCVAPGLKHQAPYLNEKNTHLFMGEGGTFEQMRLEVDGKIVGGGDAATAAAAPGGPATPGGSGGPTTTPAAAAEVVPTLARLGGNNPLPSYLTLTVNTTAGTDGLSGGVVRTVDNDLFTKDFVLDYVLKLEKDHTESFVGIGAGVQPGQGPKDSVYLAVGGPRQSGDTRIKITGSAEVFVGRTGDAPAQHYVRMAKRGNTLTWSIHPQWREGDAFNPTIVRGLPDLASAGAFLNRTNGGLFLAWDGTWTHVGLTVDGKPAGAPAEPTAPAAPAVPAVAAPALVRLGGTNPLPAFLTASVQTTADPTGLTGGTLRSLDADLYAKDFVFDLIVRFPKAEDTHGYVGLGAGDRDGRGIRDSVYVEVGGPRQGGASGIKIAGAAEIKMGSVGREPGAQHYVRLAKRGNALTCSIHPSFRDGEAFNPTIVRGLPDFAGATKFLGRGAGGLFVTGDGVWTIAGLTVSGPSAAESTATTKPATVNPATPATPPVARPTTSAAAAPAQAAGAGELFKLGGAVGLPKYLQASAPTHADADGLRDATLRTTSTDLARRDFVFDVLFKPDSKGGTFRAGVGQPDADDRGRSADAVALRLRGGTDRGRGEGAGEIAVGREATLPFGNTPGAGPHLLRIEKRGRALTFSVCLDHKGGFDPSIVKTLPDLPGVAPFLTGENGGLFVAAGGGDAVVLAVGLSVDGKPAEAGVAAAGPTTRDAADAGNFLKLAGAKSLPAVFAPNRDVLLTPAGAKLQGKVVRTVDAGYAGKNFTFDVVYRFAAGENASITVGLGEGVFGDHAALPNSVYARVRLPGSDGRVTYGTGKHNWHNEPALGPLGGPNSAHLVRVQKRNDVLTLSVCNDFNGTAVPTTSRTFPSLRAVLPSLTSKNGSLFVQADGGVIEQVRIIVDGEATETNELTLDVPPRAGEGVAVRQPIVKSAAGRTFAAVDAPVGLTLSGSGELAWTPTREQVGVQQFKVHVTEAGRTLTQAVEIEVIAKEDVAAAKGDLSKVDGLYKLPLEAEQHQVVYGLDGASLLLLEGNQLRRLGPDGLTVQQTLELPKNYRWIGERKEYFVALSDADKCLDLVDKATLKVTRSVQMQYRVRYDLALHPHLPVSYVTAERAMDGNPTPMILVVNERTGDVLEPECPATWVKASPDGRWLFAGYKDLFQRGERLLVNPGRIDVVPDCGNIDILIVYDIAGREPVAVDARSAAGGNGQGLAVSPDGKLVSYLSFVGYPAFTMNIPAWDPTDLKKRPISYPAKDAGADCKRVAFHPTLPIVAASAAGGAVCFQRDTGGVEAKRLNLRGVPAEAKVLDLTFSPDGRFLLLDVDQKGRRYLRQVPLNLSEEEAAKAKKGLVPVPPFVPREPPGRTVGGPEKA